jgi:hypothetical protein
MRSFSDCWTAGTESTICNADCNQTLVESMARLGAQSSRRARRGRFGRMPGEAIITIFEPDSS